MQSFLRKLLRFYDRQTMLFWSIIVMFIGLSGFIAYLSRIEAFPEFTNVQVQVITQYPGKASAEMERLITVPLEVALNGTPGLVGQRSVSLFGLSVITLTFDDSVQSRQARLDIRQKLSSTALPDGVEPELSPDSTPIGEIYRFTLSGTLPNDELKLLEDWVIERELKSIPGVADVVSFGGPIRTIEVQPELAKLRQLGLSIPDVAEGLSHNHANAGGSYLTHGEENYVIRSLGTYQKPQDLESAVVATIQGIPIKVRDLGQVVISHKQRLGQVGRNDQDDVVEGIVLLRQGYDSGGTCKEIRKRIEKLNSTILPKGAEIVPYYDRTNLIKRCSFTILHNVVVGILLVLLVLTLGFGLQNWNLTAGVAIVIPFALLSTFLGLKILGYSPSMDFEKGLHIFVEWYRKEHGL